MGLLYFFFSSASHPSIYTQICGAIWERVDEKIPELGGKNQKVPLSRRARSHGLMKVKVTLVTLFDGGPVLGGGVLLHLEEIFIVNRSPVARFEHAAPYVVFSLATLLPNRGFGICHPHKPDPGGPN